MKERIVVIGGGIVGSAIALEVARCGAAVTLVERDLKPKGASASSFASVGAFDEPLRDVYLLKSLGMIGWRGWTKRYGADIGARWEGEIRWAESREGVRELEALMGKATRRGYPVRWMSLAELGQRLPHAALGNVRAASFASEDGQVNPQRAIEVLRHELSKLDGNVVMGRAELEFDGSLAVVRVGEDRVLASHSVLAAGAETAEVLDRLGWDIPMDPSPGMLVYTSPVERIIDGTVYVWPESGPPIHLRQLDDGSVVVGERRQDFVADDPTETHARMLLDQAMRAFPALQDAEFHRFAVEWRPKPRDGMPIIGSLPGYPLLYVATMHAGVTLAPAVANLAAQELVGHQPSPRLEPFRPARFGEHRADAYLSVEEAFKTPSEIYLG